MLKSAAAGQIERGKLDTLQIASARSLRKLGEPKALAVLDGRLGARAAHARSRLKLLENLLRHTPAVFDGFRRNNEIGECVQNLPR